MSRELRMVPADWKHPTDGTYSDGETRYVPLFDGAEFDGRLERHRQRINTAEYRQMVKDRGEEYARNYFGEEPNPDHYMPDWPSKKRTHYQMYETTTEGTPISPVCATKEELARWLADNEASAWGEFTATYEQWLATINRGSATGMVFTKGRAMSGVEYGA